MKNYGAMRFVAGLLKFVGWLIIALGILVLLIPFIGAGKLPANSYDSGMIVFFAIISSVSIIIVGIFTVASGEMISAVADIAVNSAVTADTAKKTFAYFDQMYNRPAGLTAR